MYGYEIWYACNFMCSIFHDKFIWIYYINIYNIIIFMNEYRRGLDW
jgi:hypothetical protein